MHRFCLIRKLMRWKSRHKQITCYILAVCLLLSCPSKGKAEDKSQTQKLKNDDAESQPGSPSTEQVDNNIDNEQDSKLTQSSTPPTGVNGKDDETNERGSFPKNGSPEAAKVESTLSSLDIYRKLYRQKRKSHIEAVKAILNLGGYEKQYKMIKLLLEKMFGVLKESKLLLMQQGFSPGDVFPEDLKTQEVLSQVIENTAFVGDILLHLPYITHDILKRNREWEIMTKWGVGFCNDSKILQGTDLHLLDLVAQEMGIIEKSPDYVNPYKASDEDDRKTKEELENLIKEKMKDIKKKEKKKKRKEKLKKGPRLSGVRHNEL